MHLPVSAESRPPASEAPRSPKPLAAPLPLRSQTVPLHPEQHVALDDGLTRAPPLPIHPPISKPLPPAPMDLFFTLSAYTPPAVPSAVADTGELAQIRVRSPAPLTLIATPGAYDIAVNRINRLTDYLTPVMRALLIAPLSVVPTFTTPVDLYPLILRITSPNFSDAAVKSVADIIMSGLSAYEAKGGPAKGRTRTPDAEAAEPARKKHKSGDSKDSSGRDEDGDEVYVKRLAPGDTIAFHTTNPVTMPLLHPLLFQLHTIPARIVAPKARAGFPSFPDDAPDSDDIAVLASDSECDGDQSPPVSKAQWMSRPRVAKRKAEEDVEDIERPRKVDIVLGEYEMRMQEKWAIARKRVAMTGAYSAY